MKPVSTVVARRRRALVVTAAFLSAVVGVTALAVLAGPALRSPEQMAADAAPPTPSPVTVEVERRTLVEPIVLRGKVEPGASIPVLPPPAAIGPESVVTKVPVRRGDRVTEGRVLVERSGEPMFAMALPFALYRDLTPDLRGPDVRAVQQALRRIGYRVPVTGVFDAATQRQIGRLYRDRGYLPPENAAAPAAPVGSPATGAPATGAAATATGVTGIRLDRSAVLLVDRAGRRISRLGIKVGSVLTDPKAAVVELDGQAPRIVTTASADQASLLAVGQQVDVVDELANKRAKAEVETVGSKVVPGPDGQNGLAVRMRFAGAALDVDANRSVRLEVRVSTGGETLAVPVSAIYSRPDGTTFVTILDRGRPAEVTVATGRTAGGWVELRDPPAPIAEGVPVVVGEDAVED